MDTGVLSAVIAVSGAVGLGILNSFIAEKYRRFHDGSALAAGLAGELASYETAHPIIQQLLEGIAQAVDTGNPILLRPIPRPKDLFYEANVGKLGLLDVQLVEDVVYVYGNLNGFRGALEILANDHKDMSPEEIKGRCEATLAAVNRAFERAMPLVAVLRARAVKSFFSR